MISLLTTLSPTDSLSNCSVTIVLVPLLDSTPSWIVSLRVSWITLVPVLSIHLAGLVLGSPFGHPPTLLLPRLLFSVLVTVESLVSVPVQLVSQEPQIIGPNPV